MGDKFYALDEELCHEITPDSCVVSVLGISVSIILKKAVKGMDKKNEERMKIEDSIVLVEKEAVKERWVEYFVGLLNV